MRCRNNLRGRLTYTAVSDEETFRPVDARYLFEHHRDLLLGRLPALGRTVLAGMRALRREVALLDAITVRTRGAHGGLHPFQRQRDQDRRPGDAGARGNSRSCRGRAPPTISSPCFRDPAIAGQVDEGWRHRPFGGHPRNHHQPGPHFRRPEDEHDPGRVPPGGRSAPALGLTRKRCAPHVARLMAQFPTPSGRRSRLRTHAQLVDPDGEMMQILQRTVSDQGRKRPVPVITLGTTDTRLWRFAGMPAYVYGLTRPRPWPRANENVRVDEFPARPARAYLPGRGALPDGGRMMRTFPAADLSAARAYSPDGGHRRAASRGLDHHDQCGRQWSNAAPFSCITPSSAISPPMLAVPASAARRGAEGHGRQYRRQRPVRGQRRHRGDLASMHSQLGRVSLARERGKGARPF